MEILRLEIARKIDKLCVILTLANKIITRMLNIERLSDIYGICAPDEYVIDF